MAPMDPAVTFLPTLTWCCGKIPTACHFFEHRPGKASIILNYMFSFLNIFIPDLFRKWRNSGKELGWWGDLPEAVLVVLKLQRRMRES